MKKKVLSALLCVAMVGTMLVGCGSKPAEKVEDAAKEAVEKTESVVEEAKDKVEEAMEGDIKIEVVAKGFQHDFWKAVKAGAEKAAEEYGVQMNFVGPEGESAIQEQVTMVNTALSSKPAALCLAALDPSSIIEALNTAKADGIPVIGFDSGIPDAPEGTVAANASTDNVKAGELAAEHLYEVVKDKVANPENVVRIGVAAQDATSSSILGRTNGFIDKFIELAGGKDKVSVEGHDAYGAKVDGAKIIIEVAVPASVNDADALQAITSVLQKEDVIGFYASNEFSAKALINANNTLQKLGTDKIPAIGFDAGKQQLDAVRNGVFIGSITQDPVMIGFKAVELAVKAHKGEAVADVDTGAQWYDASNMDEEGIKACLYE